MEKGKIYSTNKITIDQGWSLRNSNMLAVGGLSR